MRNPGAGARDRAARGHIHRGRPSTL